MYEKIRRIIKQFKEFELSTIWLFSLVLIIILIVLAIILSIKSKNEEENRIYIPLSTNFNSIEVYTKINIDEELINSVKTNNNLKSFNQVYSIDDIDYATAIDKIVNDLGLSDIEKSCENDKCYWQNSDYYVEYNKRYQRFFIRVEDDTKFNLDELFASGDNEEDKFKNFVEYYFGENIKYSSVVLNDESETKMIEAIREIEGAPLIIQSPLSYSDYVMFNKKDEISAVQITLIRPDKENAQKVKILDIENIGVYARNSSYSQKTYYLRINDLGPSNEPDDLLAVYSGQYDFPYPKSCYSSNVQVGYSYIDADNDRLFPVFKVECSGEVNWEGRRLEVGVVKIINAINPKYLEN